MKSFVSENVDRLSRRDFIKLTVGLWLSTTGMALLEACGADLAAPGGPKELETTTVRLVKPSASICLAPQVMAEQLLHQQGFTNVQYVELVGGATEKALASGEADVSLIFVARGVKSVDAHEPVTMLSGIHVGCFELFGTPQIQEMRDLKGKTIPVSAMDSPQHSFLATMLTYVGLDPNRDIDWVVLPPTEAIQLLAENKVDAFLAFPPAAQELRAKKIGHVLLNSMMDDPWSGYFCCMVGVNTDFIQKNPVATKQVLTALLQATDLCAREPERAAHFMVDNGYAANYEYAFEAMKQIPYNIWREYDPEDTLRFYALRLREAGMIKSSPEEIIKQGTDWRFLNELKAELKG
jgi:NitT/TauT family transport system substrate-binding protein